MLNFGLILILLYFYSGGVLTPGVAFGKTSLIEQMIKHNIKFEVISSTEK